VPEASVRAAIVVTGTEVLGGRVTDRNGPWLSERLLELGVDVALITVVGDRLDDMLAQLRHCADLGIDLVVTSGGLGPTADDLTAAVVAQFSGREMHLDDELEERIAEILRPLAKRFPNLDMDAVRASNRKQALVPEGATVLEPVGTAPGLVVPPREPGAGPTVVVLPGPPRELQPMWATAVQTPALREVLDRAGVYEQRMLRLFGIPESEIAETLREADRQGVDLERLEITTCLRRGEVEVVTRFAPAAADVYAALAEVIGRRHGDTLFSDDGRSVDEQVAALLVERSLTIAVAESCTGGLAAARLTELPGSSRYMLGGVVAYADAAKIGLVGVPADLVKRFGAVSTEVAEALADGARARFGADVGVGVTGVAGPEGGTEEKPVGLVCFSVSAEVDGDVVRLTRRVQLPGSRADVRDRSTTVAMHLIRRLLLGETDAFARFEERGSRGAAARTAGVERS
jgi:nicotinamide-nucleotide amidase